nr:hypothetical protein [Mycolicibacterium sphagni]
MDLNVAVDEPDSAGVGWTGQAPAHLGGQLVRILGGGGLIE